MATPRAVKRTGRAGVRRRKGSRRRRRIAGVGLAGLVAASFVFVYCWVTVGEQFEGHRWPLPARIYSAPMRLAEIVPVTREEIVARLERSGYARFSRSPTRPGGFREVEGGVEIYSRGFEAGDRSASAVWMRVSFRGRRIVSVVDRSGRPVRSAMLEPELVGTFFGPRQEERQPVAIEEVPDSLIQAVLAAEDLRFYRHAGLDLRGIGRAAWANLRGGQILQGGSTITQQTVKNLFLSPERNWWRKSREAVMALILDARYPKDRILETYLNDAYLGQRGSVAICGIQAASRFYFGRDVRHIGVGESALLAGLIRSPGQYNPFVHPERARARRDQVLAAMERAGLLSAEAAGAAGKESIALASGRGGYVGASHVVELVRAQLAAQFDPSVLQTEALRVYTSLDTRWQAVAERALRDGLERLERDEPSLKRQRDRRRIDGAIVVTRPETGEILALVGGRDFTKSQFNRVTQARRQPGSCFKPFVFAAAFEAAGDDPVLTPASLLEDQPIRLRSGGKVWEPKNFDGEFRGPVTVRRALVESLNVPTVRAAMDVGLDRVVDLAHGAGIESPLPEFPSTALGATEVTPLELAAAYGTFANGGMRRVPWLIRDVIGQDGRSLGSDRPSGRRAMSAATAFLVNDILREVLESGTARSAGALGYDGIAAGKTGTTDDMRDAWFVGYSRRTLALVWVGFDDNAQMGLTGARAALPIWVATMVGGEAGTTAAQFNVPGSIVRREICPETGELATSACPDSREEVFSEGSEPTRACSTHGGTFRRWFERLFRPDQPQNLPVVQLSSPS